MQTARINIEKLSIPVLRKSRDESTGNRMNSSINARFTAKRPINNLVKSIAFNKPTKQNMDDYEELSMGSLGSVEKQGDEGIQDVNLPPQISAGTKKNYGSYLSFNRTQPIKISKTQKISYKSSI